MERGTKIIPTGDPQTPLVLQLDDQIECALIGLVTTVMMLGFVISQFIPRPFRVHEAGPAGQRYPGRTA
jgi:hypothetical protein